jgi:hypothetical protein
LFETAGHAIPTGPIFAAAAPIDAMSMIYIELFLPKTQQFDLKVKSTPFERRFLRVHTHKPN